MSRSEEVDDSAMGSDEDFPDQAQTSAGTLSKYSSSYFELGSIRIPHPHTLRRFNRSSVPSSRAQSVNRLDDASSSSDAASLKDMQKPLGAFLPPGQIRQAISEDLPDQVQTSAGTESKNSSSYSDPCSLLMPHPLMHRLSNRSSVPSSRAQSVNRLDDVSSSSDAASLKHTQKPLGAFLPPGQIKQTISEDLPDQAQTSAGTESKNSSSLDSDLCSRLPHPFMTRRSKHSSAPSSPAQSVNRLDDASSSSDAASLKDMQKPLGAFLPPGQIRQTISEDLPDQAQTSAGIENKNSSPESHLHSRLPHPFMTGRTKHFSAPSLPAQSVNQLDDASSISDSESLKDMQKSLGAFLSSRQIRKAVSDGKLDGWKEVHRRDLLSSAANRKANFSTPPQHGPVPVVRSVLMNLTGTSTSPDERSDKMVKEFDLTTFLALGQIQKASSTHEKSDGWKEVHRRYLLSSAANSKADFSTPPQRNPVPETKPLSHNLTVASTPSPDKRSVETDVDLTASKRFRKTPESNPDKPETLTESCGSKTSISVAEEASKNSPTYLQIQQSIQKNEESKSVTTPSIPSERKTKTPRRISGDSNTGNNSGSLEYILPTLTANIHEPLTDLPMQESELDVQDVGESDPGTEILISTRDSSAESKFLSSPSNPDRLHETASSLCKPTYLLPSTRASSTSERHNKAGSQEHSQLYPGVDLGAPALTLKNADMHPTTITDASSSNHGAASKSQNSRSEGFESRIDENATQDSTSVSSKETLNPGNSIIETQISESSLTNPANLNPVLPSSCFTRKSDGATSNVSHQAFVKKEISNESEFASSTRSSTRDGESRPKPKRYSVFRRQRMHRRSLSEKTRENRSSPKSEPSSSSQRCVPRVNTDESLPPHSLEMDSIGSHEMLRNLPGDVTLHTFLRQLLDLKYAAINIPEIPIDIKRRVVNALRSFSYDQQATARNNPEEQMQPNLNQSLANANIVRLFQPSTLHYSRPPVVRGDNPPYIDIFEGQASTSTFQPRIEESLNFQPGSSLHFATSSERSDVIQGGAELLRTHLAPESSASSSSSTSSLPDNHPEYVVNALTLLRSVLKEMMMYNGEEDTWATCEPLFRRFLESGSKLDRMRLSSTLMLYLANRGYGLWTRNLFTTQEATPEALMLIHHEKLILIVITTINSILTQHKIEFQKAYSSLKDLHVFFTQYWQENRVEDVQDEVSRKHAALLREMIQRFMLVTRMAMQLGLMHMGENNDDEYLQMISAILAEEDRMYLRRRV